MKNKTNSLYGYNQVKIIPWVGIYAATVLLISSVVGIYISLLLVTIPAFKLTKRAAKRDTVEWDMVYAEVKEYERNMENMKRPSISIKKPQIRIGTKLSPGRFASIKITS